MKLIKVIMSQLIGYLSSSLLNLKCEIEIVKLEILSQLVIVEVEGNSRSLKDQCKLETFQILGCEISFRRLLQESYSSTGWYKFYHIKYSKESLFM